MLLEEGMDVCGLSVQDRDQAVERVLAGKMRGTAIPWVPNCKDARFLHFSASANL